MQDYFLSEDSLERMKDSEVESQTKLILTYDYSTSFEDIFDPDITKQAYLSLESISDEGIRVKIIEKIVMIKLII